jgi:hypothetical protein
LQKKLLNTSHTFDIGAKVRSKENCSHFSESDIVLVKDAIQFAEWLHLNQERKSWAPYIEHIFRSVNLYLDETLWWDEVCDLEDLLILILHDCIEDCKEDEWAKIIELFKKFGISVWIGVLRLSEPSQQVITHIRLLKDTFPYLFSIASELGFLHMYDLVDENNPEEWIGNLKSSPNLSSELCHNIKEYWYKKLAPLYYSQQDPIEQKSIFGDLIALANIASYWPRLFRIKWTERRDNLQDYEGLMTEKWVRSARKTMDTTSAIYVPKAWEIWDYWLKISLIFDVNKERAAFVMNGLMRPGKKLK